jgi:uncharacterized membrane-anchored protein YhcB (DUF1043 family)
MTLTLIFLVAILLVGMFVGCTLSERLLGARTRRQATVQRYLNSQWQELESQWQEFEAIRHENARRQEGEQLQPARR